MHLRRFAAVTLAFSPLAAGLLSGCGAISSLIPAVNFGPTRLVSGSPTLPVVQTTGSLPTSNPASTVSPIETFAPGTSFYDNIHSDLQKANLLSLDATIQLTTSGAASGYPATAGLVVTTDPKPDNSSFWQVANGGTDPAGYPAFGFELKMPAAGTFVFAPTSTGVGGSATYAGPLAVNPDKGLVQSMFESGGPVYVYARTLSPSATVSVSNLTLSGSAQPHL